MAEPSMREFVEFLEKEGELFKVKAEIDPKLEVAGLQKKIDSGPALLLENVKGYPNMRIITGMIEENKICKLWGADRRSAKLKGIEAVKHPLPPKVVKEAPCQEVVISKDIDATAILPFIQHTENTPRALGGGITLIGGKYFDGGYHCGYHRMHFRGKDWSSIQFAPGGHADQIVNKAVKAKERIPITVNLCPSPAVHLAAGSAFIYTLFPFGADELAPAGRLQGAPVELVKARTVDAYAFANSEIVLEGYINTGERVWETEEAEKLGKQGVAPLHPEWTGYLGKAYRAFKFETTAITHRKDRPIFYAPIAHCFDHYISDFFRMVGMWMLCEAIRPGIVVDCNVVNGIASWAGVILQVRKTWKQEEGWQRSMLAGVASISQGLNLAVAVDEDVDIYSADDVMWALATRMDPVTSVFVAGGGKGQTLMPLTRAGGPEAKEVIGRYGGCLAIDATVPFAEKWRFERAPYPVNKIDLRRWLTEEQIAKAQGMMAEYGKVLAATGR